MGFRFRKSIGPKWLKLNITKNGISSVSVGRTGAKLNIPVNRQGGVRGTVGIPGNGLSWSEQAPARRSTARTSRQTYKEAPEPITPLSPLELEAQRIGAERKARAKTNEWGVLAFVVLT